MRAYKPFGLPNTLDYDATKFTKQVKTKSWVKKNSQHLGKWQDRLTTANIDNRQVIGSMLQAGFGYNIGQQVEQNLSDDDLVIIKRNIINLYNK